MTTIWAVLSVLPAIAHAESVTAPVVAPPHAVAPAIDVVPGATCVDRARLEAQVVTWLGSPRIPRNVRVFVRGDANNPRVIAFRIVRDGAIRERKFDPAPAGCDEMHAVLGLSIALSIDVNAVQRFLDPDFDVPKSPRLLTLELGGGQNAIPGTSFGGAAGVEYGWLGWLSARGEALAQYSFDDRVENTSGTFEATVVAGSLRACGGGRLSRGFRIALCVGGAFGMMHTRGHGYTVSHSATGGWVTALSGVRLEFVLGIPWVLDADVVSPVWVPAIRVQEARGGDHLSEASAGLLIGVGPAFQF